MKDTGKEEVIIRKETLMDQNLGNMVNIIKLKKIVHWLLTLVIALYILTGFGITRFRIVEPLTLGLLTKVWAFKIHIWLTIPLIVLLALHIYLTTVRRSKKQKA
jgi:thiosulfate reductase cytochrome b subunit